jgi:hypothetical protein
MPPLHEYSERSPSVALSGDVKLQEVQQVSDAAVQAAPGTGAGEQQSVLPVPSSQAVVTIVTG